MRIYVRVITLNARYIKTIYFKLKIIYFLFIVVS